MLSKNAKDGDLTIAEAAETLFCSKSRIYSLCREKVIYGATKEGGSWRIPFSGLFPVLRKPECADSKAEIRQLKYEFPLADIGYACNLLTTIQGYNKLVLAFLSEGESDFGARLRAYRMCHVSLYRIERLSSEYNRHGLRGLIEYTRACDRAIGSVALDEFADEAFMTLVNHEFTDKSGNEKPLSIRWYMGTLSDYNDTLLEKVREALEKSPEGQRIVKASPNKRLYAVLKPTREENMQRIEYVLTGLGPFTLFDLLASIKLAQVLYEHECCDTEP